MTMTSILFWFIDLPVIAFCIVRLIMLRFEMRRYDLVYKQRAAMLRGRGFDGLNAVRRVSLRAHAHALKHGPNGPARLYGQVWHDTFPNPYL